MKPVILITAGIERTDRGLIQSYCYKTYSEAVSNAGGIPLIVGDDSNLEELADRADGLYLTGGNDVDPTWYQGCSDYCEEADPWRDHLENRLIHLFMERKKPIFGICRGMQQINVTLGGSLFEDIGHRLNLEHPFEVPHTVHAKPNSKLHRWYGEEFTVNSFHHQAINQLGDGLEVVAWTEDRIVEAVAHKSLPIFGVQWHPERMTGDQPYTPVGPDMNCLFEDFCRMCAKS